MKILLTAFLTLACSAFAQLVPAGTSATNNLSAPERARVTELRPQLSFPQAPNITQADRDRFAAIVAELQKVEALTNVVLVDPESLPKVSIGE